MGPEREGEPFLPLPLAIAPVTAARSTLVLASIAALRAAGRGEAYESQLPSKYRELLLQSAPGAWLPIAAAIAHYEACDALGLSTDVTVDLGRDIGERMKGTLLGTVVRMAKGMGMTPWTVMPQFPRFWARAYEGGAIGGLKVGPKEARIELHRAAVAESRHFRLALCGVAMSVLDMFCTRSYVTEIPGKRPPGGALVRVQWA